ncbi:hypothetical protein [Vibrio gazogenes]|uniref:Cupin n=1 Tax=Vibrio gazogenes TaxID=687 RepID=A0A1Z2SDP4_VIBGA|nr:hypothetical protein [Vibrio gazogenes]ASA55285.1 hypothetical protein BSQ33_05810 [Vibrio gazogenes]
MSEEYRVEHRNHYSVFKTENLSDLRKYTFAHNAIAGKVAGKLFLSQVLNCSGSIVSLNQLESHTSLPFYHRHLKNEEIYFFIKGTGQFLIDDDCIDVYEGTAIRVSPEGVRGLTNNADEVLVYLVIQGVLNSFSLEQTIEDGRIVEM